MASSISSSSVISNPGDRSRDPSKRKKKKKTQAMMKHNGQEEDKHHHIKWKSQSQQQIYSSKLHQALSRLNLDSASAVPRRGKAVRDAADTVLAVAAKGRSRWSRAILTNRLKLKFTKHKRHRISSSSSSSSAAAAAARSRKPRLSVFRLKGKSVPAVQSKVRYLGRLVPGCRKQPAPVILEEAIDYISALEMQVRAMTALADLLSGAGTSTSSAPPS